MGSYISQLFVDTAQLPNNVGGFIQLLFLMATYSFFLYQGSQLISNGSELLLLVPAVAGIVGSVVLPVLGAVPDGAIVLFSGLGSDAQEQLDVGVGALAGSTVMLLTLPWALCIFAGRVDLDPQTGLPRYKKPRGAAGEGWTKLTPGLGWRHALFGSGVPMLRPMRINGGILAFTSLAYLLIQVPAFYVGCGSGSDCARGHQEKYWALGGFFFATIAFIGYLIYQVRVGGEETFYQEKLTEIITSKVDQGFVGVGAAFFAFIKEEDAEMKKAAAHAHHGVPTSSPSAGLIANEVGTGSPPTVSRQGSVAIPIHSGVPGANEPALVSHLRTEKKMHLLLKRFFKKYDRDNSGFIDLPELTNLLKDIGVGGGMSSDAVRSLFVSMDSSHDGRVDFGEFYEAMMIVLAHPSLAGELEASAKRIKAEAAGSNKQANEQGAATPRSKVEALQARRGQSVANLNALIAQNRAGGGGGGDGSTPATPATPFLGTGSYGSLRQLHSHQTAAPLGLGASPPAGSDQAASVPFTGRSLSLRHMAGSSPSDDAAAENEDDEPAFGGDDSEVEEDEEEVPEDLKDLEPAAQQRAIILRSAWMMGLGTALILLFSDPMVDCLTSLGKRTHIPVFYVSFLLAPLAANASELLAAVNYAAKKTPASITISLTSLEGSATMNNTFCLLIFLMLVFAKDLVWEFSAETISILVVEVVASLMTMKKVHRGIDAIILLCMYPLAMGLVALLENAAGLN